MGNKEKNSTGAEIVSGDYLKSEKLLDNEGFILGVLENNAEIADTSNMNVLTFTPTGSGKGVACVIPNLLTWKDSVIVHDIKTENFELTSGYRKEKLGQNVFLWHPTVQKTHRFNPLELLRDKDVNPVSLSQKIAKILLPNEDCYSVEARNLLMAIILYVKDLENNNFGEVFDILQSGSFEKLISEKNNYLPVNYLRSYLLKENFDREKIRSKALESINLWADTLIRDSTMKSDFDLKKLNQEPTSIYIGVSVNEIDRLKTLFQIFYLECFECLMLDEMKTADTKKSTLMILDQFCSIGKMEFIENKLPFTRGYKLKLVLLAQNLNEILLTYGEIASEQILLNCPFKLIFAPNDYETAKFLSKTIGNKILIDKEGTKTKQRLFYPEELINMEKSKELIILNNSKIVLCDKLMYYREKKFKDKMLEALKI